MGPFNFRSHTLAFIKENMSVCTFGLGTVGQLGNGRAASSRVPSPVVFSQPPALTGEGSSVDQLTCVVKRIFAGGDQSFASVEPLVCTGEEGEEPLCTGVHVC